MKKRLFFLLLPLIGFSQWAVQNTGFSATSRGLGSIQIVDANTVWALAYDGSGTGTGEVQEFTRTTNGGTTWTPGIINVNDVNKNINNICPISGTTAWVSALVTTAGKGVIYKTTDGGVTWTQQNSSGFQSASSFINFVHFFDANEGIAFGDPVNGEFEVYRSTNGGSTWTQVAGSVLPDPNTGEYGYNNGNVAIGNAVYLPTNKGRLLKSYDRGLTWNIVSSPISDFGSQTGDNGRIFFSTSTKGALLRNGSSNNFYTTNDGGDTWNGPTSLATDFKLLSYIPNTNTIIATSANTADGTGTAVSTDNGVTFADIDFGVQRGVNAFLNNSTGWCAGFNTSSTVGGIFKFTGNSLANPSFNNENSFSVYPNPVENTLSISNFDMIKGLNKINVVDISGKSVMEFSNLDNNSIDVSKLSSGVYFLKINKNDEIFTKKFIKN